MANNCFKNLVDCNHCDPSIIVHRDETYETEVQKVLHAYQRFYRTERKRNTLIVSHGSICNFSPSESDKHLVAGRTFGNGCRSRSLWTHMEDLCCVQLTTALVKHQQRAKCHVFVKITWAAEAAMAKDNAENILTVKTIAETRICLY